MGLDNFWVKPGLVDEDGQEEVFELEGLKVSLCGGMLSGNGSGSFRGKVYAEVVEEATGISLYSDRLTNEQVMTIASLLQKNKPSEFPTGPWETTEEEYNNLIEMFQAYGEAGAELVSWY